MCGYDEVEEIEKSYQIVRQGQLIDECSAAAGLFMGANDDQDQFRIYNEQIATIDYVDQSQLCSHRVSGPGNPKKQPKGQPAAQKGQKFKSKAANEKQASKKKGKKNSDHGTSAIDMQPLSA